MSKHTPLETIHNLIYFAAKRLPADDAKYLLRRYRLVSGPAEAAPALLSALYEARDRMLGNSPAITALRAKTDAAIAKATGEPSPTESIDIERHL